MTTREQRVLDYVNHLRKKYDIGPPIEKLPKGERRQTRKCPIALGLSNGGYAVVRNNHLRIVDHNGHHYVVNHPKYIVEWLQKYDKGQEFEDLIAA